MPLVALGISHKTAPEDVRVRHALTAAQVGHALGAMHEYPQVREAVLLSTCNRLEIYAGVDEIEAGVADLKRFLTTYRSMRVDDFEQYLYTLLGADAVEHALRVAAGLDSMLVGETEIVAQVREAMTLAQAAGTLGPHLGRLFRVALETGKRARAETAIARDPASLGSAAVELAARHADLRNARVLVIGAGKMATIVAKNLRARGAGTLTIANRTLARALELGRQTLARAVALSELDREIAAADVVVASVQAEKAIVGAAALQAERPGRDALVVIDISVPHAVERSASGPRVFGLDDLHEIVDESLRKRRGEIPAVERIVSEGAERYHRWYRTRVAGPAIAQLRKLAEEIRDGEVQRLFARLPELDERQRADIVATSVTIINRMLHAPVTTLLDAARGGSATAFDDAIVDLERLRAQIERQLEGHLGRSGAES